MLLSHAAAGAKNVAFPVGQRPKRSGPQVLIWVEAGKNVKVQGSGPSQVPNVPVGRLYGSLVIIALIHHMKTRAHTSDPTLNPKP